MKRLLFISLFLLINGAVNAQNQRISVDLLSPGIGRLVSLNSPTDELHWYSLTYESKREEGKTWGVRAAFAGLRGVNYYSYEKHINLTRQIKGSIYRKKYVTSRFFGEPFVGYYATFSYLTDGDYSIFFNGERSSDLNSGFHFGGGTLFGTNFYLSKDLLIEFVGGLGLGASLNSELYERGEWSFVNNGLILFSPSFFDINLYYEF